MSSISPDFFGMKDTNQESKTLKELLEERAVNKTKLAERMGIGRATLNSWESGKKVPAFDNAIRLAAELGVSLKTLGESLGYDVSRVPDENRDDQN
jgi:transcriptional regulator with XRE-family HTH domain